MEAIMNDFRVAKECVDQRLKEYMAYEEPLLKVLVESIDYSLFSGGKRVRPLFCFIVGELFGVQKEKLISLACAVEMIHTASLIMDDLPHMDDAEMRRGKPANHMVYGQDVASLASIGLLTKAYEVVLQDPVLPDDKKTRVVQKLANIVGIEGMVGGQFVDLKYSTQSMEYSTLEYIHIHKTASLFMAVGTSAGIIGGASENELLALEHYAKKLGFAFQIMDDLLDVDGNPDEMGKPKQKDKGNFVRLLGAEKSKILAKECAEKAIEATSIFAGKNKKLIMLGKILLARRK
jgi:geranylgeranyl diphosphate synthase, type II